MVSDSEKSCLTKYLIFEEQSCRFCSKDKGLDNELCFFLIKRKKNKQQLPASFFCRGGLSYSWDPLI